MDSVYIPHKNRNNPFISDTLSEIHDEKEKNAIFSHSLKHGVYNEIRNSPLRDRLPRDLQIYNPALEKRLFAKEAAKAPGMGQASRFGAKSKINPLDEAPTELNKDLLLQTSNNLRFK